MTPVEELAVQLDALLDECVLAGITLDKRNIAALERLLPPRPKHEAGELHHYQLECTVCGQQGTVNLSIEPQRA